jgi:hypothetical protein
VRPGIAGWALADQEHVAALEKLRYDFCYIENPSPWLDILGEDNAHRVWSKIGFRFPGYWIGR